MADSPAPPGHVEQRGIPRRDVLKYAGSAPLLLGLGALASAINGPKASAANPKLIDFSERLVAPDLIKSAGYAGALVYVAESRPGANFDFKPVTREYADGMRAAGLQIVSCYQYGKPGWPDPSDFTRGYDGGVADAQTALRLHTAAGGGNSAPIFFSVDEDIDGDTWKHVALEWFRGINSVLGAERTGIYGHNRACAWAIEDGVIGRSTTAGHWWAWQTIGWSAGQREPRAVLLQVVVNTPSEPGVVLGGTHVDVDNVLAADFGQWDLHR